MVDNVKKAATEEKRRRWSGGLTLTLSPTLTQTLALSPALALRPTLALTLTRWSGGYSEPTRDGEPPAYGTRDSEPDVGARLVEGCKSDDPEIGADCSSSVVNATP